METSSQQPNNLQVASTSNPESAPPKPKHKIRRIVLCVLAFLFGALIAFVVDYRAVYDWILGFSYEPSSQMSQIISNIELTNRGMRIVKASFAEFQNANDFNDNCPTVTAETSVLGCYYNWRIYVYDIDNSELDGIKEAVLAHELLHADWQRERTIVRNELEPILRDVYEQNKEELSEHMKSYTEDNFTDELHSVIGTQLDTSKLPKRLQDHYNSLFKNHSKIISYFNKYNGKFLELKQKMEELATKINKMKAEIEQLTKEYREKSQTLSDDIDLFNKRAVEHYYQNQWTFDTDRAALVERQKSLNNDYQKLSKLVDEANEYVAEYNQNVIRSGELYDSINSNVKKIDGVTK